MSEFGTSGFSYVFWDDILKLLDQKPLTLVTVFPMFTVGILSGLLYICTDYMYVMYRT